MLERSHLVVSLVPPALLALLVAAPGCGSSRLDPAAVSAGLETSFPGRSGAVLRAGGGFTQHTGGFRGEAGGRFAIDLPADGAGAVVLRPEGGGAVSVREIGVAGAARAFDRAVGYGRLGGASFWTALPGGAEEWLRFEAGALRDGQPAAAWEIAGATLTQRGEAVEVDVAPVGAASPTSFARLHVSAPLAFAEGGAPVAARLRVVGATIELFVDAGGRGVLVDPMWMTVASMPEPLEYSVSTPLADGRVLVVGGDDGPPYALPVAYSYDFATNAWATETPMATARENHTATSLSDGTVLVAGGFSDSQPFAETIELYDPTAKTWTSNMMPHDHAGHTATTLKDGTILLAGGFGPGSSGGSFTSDNVDLYDPTMGMGGWGNSTQMNETRAYHAACRLNDGTVLVTGGASNGSTLADAEIYDPVAQTWTFTAQPMNDARQYHVCALLADGTVLVAGGDQQDDGINVLASAEIYDPIAQTWTEIQPMATPRAWHQIVPIPGGKLMVVGGDSDGGGSTLPTTEIYDPVAKTWTPGPTLNEPREVFSLSLVGNDILVAGGWDSTTKANGGITATAEVVSFGLPDGTACTAAAACASGFCAAGLCCDSACTGTCMACTAKLKGTGKDGTCGPVEAGTDPGNVCTDQGASSCGTDGLCDGSGACGTYPDGTVCLETTPCIVAVCAGGKCGGPSKLDGSPCPGGVCIAGACVPDPSVGSSSSSSSTSSSTGSSSSTSSSSSGAGGGTTSTATTTSGQGGQSAGDSLSGNGCGVGRGGEGGSAPRPPAMGIGLALLWCLSKIRRRS
jgi:N-acetylneuraminic acid mutarotase